MDHLTHEAIDSRLLGILKETDDLFQSGQLKYPPALTDLNTPLLYNDNKQFTHLTKSATNNVVNTDVFPCNLCKYGIEPIKSANGNGHFFSNPINTSASNYGCVNSLLSHNDNQLYKVNEKTKLYEAKQFEHKQFNSLPFNQRENFKHLEQIKQLDSYPLNNTALTKCLAKDLSIVSNWEESQKEVFYNFADKLKQEYHRLQHQLYTQYKLDLEKNIKVLRSQYSNTIDGLQQELINLKTYQQTFSTREAEYEEKLFRYESDICIAKQEIENLYKELQTKREQIMVLSKQMCDYENAISELKYGKSTLEEIVAERDKQLEAIESELSSSINKSELEHRKNSTLNQSLLETNAIISATKNELALSKREIDKLNSEVERLNGIVKILRETESNLNQRLSESAASNTSLVSKLDNLNLEKSALYNRIEEITSGYEKQLSICNRRINQLEIEMESKVG